MAKRQPSLPWSNADFSALVDSYSRNEGLDTLDQLLNGHVLKIIKDCDFEVKLGSQSVSLLLTSEVSTSKAIESSIRRLLSKIVGYLKAPKRNIDNIKCLLAAPFSEPKLAKRQKIDIPAPVEAPVKEPLLKLKTDCEKCPSLRKNLTTATASLKESLKSLRHSNIKIRKKFKVKRINQERRRKEECISNLKKTVRDLTTKNALLSREVRSLQKLSTSHMLGKIQKEQRRIRDLRSQLAAKEQRIQSLKLVLEEKEMKVINLEMMLHEKEEEMATFLHKERTEKTEKHKKQRVYGSTIRKCLYQCLLSQVPVEKAGPLLGNLWTNITGDSIVTPGPSTVAQMAYELGVLSDLQIGEHLNRCSHATIAWDATSLEGVHVNEIHICIEQGLFTLQIGDLPGGRTEDYFQHISNALTDIAHTYSKYTQEPIAEVLERFYDGITSTLSDRAPVNNCVASELSVLVNKQLIILNCNVHPLDGLASTTRQTLKNIDTQLQIHSGIYGNEGRAANLLYAISKLRYKDGPGDPAGFKTFLESQKIKPGVIVRYRGNRLHILFHLAGVVVMLRDKLVLYLKKYCASAKLRLAILADLENDLIFLQLQILGLLGKTLTGPWMTLFYKNAEKKKHLEMVEGGDFPHLLVYGPSGAGKKTRIMCTLRELYGSGVEKLRIEQSHFTTPSNKKLEITTISSNYHIEVNPSDVGFNDRVVIQELIKNVAQVNQLDTTSQKNFKVVVLTEVDRLTKDAQHALRRTMEKYMATCRLILCCNSTSKVIPAIRSRCLGIRVAAPSIEEICQILTTVCKKEGLTLPQEMAVKIAEKSGRNLRRALLMCEACRVQQYPFNVERDVSEPDWEIFLRETATMIAQQQSPKRLLEVRGRLYELLTHCIPPDIIMKGLLKELVAVCDGQLKAEVVQSAAFYEHRLQQGQKAIYHLEAFVAKFMAIYKRFLEEGIADLF